MFHSRILMRRAGILLAVLGLVAVLAGRTRPRARGIDLPLWGRWHVSVLAPVRLAGVALAVSGGVLLFLGNARPLRRRRRPPNQKLTTES